MRKSTKDNSNRNRLMSDLNIALNKWKLLGNIAALLVFSVHTRLNKEKFSDFRVFARIRNCRKPEIARDCREGWSPSLETFREELKSLYSDLLSPVLCGQHSKVMWGLIKLPDLQGVSQGAAFKPEESQPFHFQHDSKTPLFSLELFTVACFSSHTLWILHFHLMAVPLFVLPPTNGSRAHMAEEAVICIPFPRADSSLRSCLCCHVQIRPLFHLTSLYIFFKF